MCYFERLTGPFEEMMRPVIYAFLISILISSCQSDREKTIEGDLYFKLVDIERFFDAPDSTLTAIEHLVKKLNEGNSSEQDRENLTHFKFMVDNGLLREPFIWLKLDNDDNRILFLDSSEYVQFGQYKWSNLSRSNQKVRIKAIVKEFEYPYYFAKTTTAYKVVRILSVNKIEGMTYWDK
jgi:hypothetical protein